MMPGWSAPSDPMALPGTTWQVVALAGESLPETAASLDLAFAADGAAVQGSGGVNRYGGAAALGEGTLSVGVLRSTRRAGPPEAMEREAAFFRALAEVRSYRLEESGRVLLLLDGNGALLVKLRRVDG